jgi:hypothetical protein
VASGRYRTRLQNTHRTEKREVLYPWHPWAGRIVDIHEVIEKASGHVARCSLNGEETHRSLELPTWMLDRVACAPMRMDAHPWLNVAALDALTALLAEVSVARAASSNIPVAGAQTVSREENRGDHDAVPTQGASRPSIQDSPVRSVRSARRQGDADAGVGRPSGGDPPGTDTPDGAVAPRSRGRRALAKGGRR